MLLDVLALVLGGWGALLSTALYIGRRRRKLLVRAEFGIARLGSTANHAFFYVALINVGERPVSIESVEWRRANGDSFQLGVFRVSSGGELPAIVEPDAELRVLFDVDHAAKALADDWVESLAISASGAVQRWIVLITDEMRQEARELLEADVEDDEIDA